MEHIHLGHQELRRQQLAPADLAFACDGLPDVRHRSRRPSRREHGVARRRCCGSLLGVAVRYRVRRPQLHGGCAVCLASDQRGVGGLGCRAQDDAQHLLLPLGAGGVSLVREKAQQHALLIPCGPFYSRPDGQAADHHPAFRVPAVGLLALAAHVPRSRPERRKRAVPTENVQGAGQGEDPPLHYLSCRRAHHAEGATCRPAFRLAVFDLDPHWQCDRRLRPLHR